MNKPFQISSQVYHPVVCPVCAGAGTLEAGPPVPLTPMQYRVWDAIRKSRFGLTTRAIARSIYSNRHDGGPVNSRTCVYMTIKHANRRLAAAGLKIANTDHVHGGVYTIQRIDGGS